MPRNSWEEEEVITLPDRRGMESGVDFVNTSIFQSDRQQQ